LPPHFPALDPGGVGLRVWKDLKAMAAQRDESMVGKLADALLSINHAPGN
jgi:hypothetical protein